MTQQPRVITNIRLIFSALIMATIGVGAYRFYGGLGAATNLNDSFPWGWWIGFDMICGVALAAGGFVLAGVVHIFQLKKYEVFVRPAIVTAFLGYVLAILGLLLDLGRPWLIWHPLVFWQPRSIMFEVGWCVTLYTTVLFLEFLPIVFERFRMFRLLRLTSRVMIVFIIAGIILSTLHQSSLGSLFMMMGHHLHPLWSTPMLPVLFLASAIAVGVAMVIFESILSGMIFGHRLPIRLLGDLAKSLPPILGLYLGFKLMDLNARGAFGHLAENSLESWAYLLETMIGVVLPGILLLNPAVRYNRSKLFGCVLMVLVGVVMNRLNVSLLGMIGATPEGYLPSWMELLASAGLIAGGLLVLTIMTNMLPITTSHDAQERQAPAAT